MIEPTPSDIGRRVIYRAQHGIIEYGVITSYNDKYIFVKFNYTEHGIACSYADLEFDKEAIPHDYPTN